MFQHLISQYGYLAVFVLMLAESACIPVPSEVVMMFGGALAAGAVPGARPALVGVFAAGVLGNIAGSYTAWAVGKYAGQAAIRRWGRRVGIREHEIDKATAWFERHGPVAVLVGRVIPVIRTFISLPAGFADMSPGVFGLYTTLGAIPWTAVLAILGYAVGANWDSVAKDFNGPTYAIAGILLVAIVVLIIRRRKAAAASAAPGRAPGDGWAGPAAARPQRDDPAAAYAPAAPAGRPPAMQMPPSGRHAPRDPWAQPQAGQAQPGQAQGGWDYQPGPSGQHRSLSGRQRAEPYGPLTFPVIYLVRASCRDIPCDREQ
ncbi:MAG TPA: DedA family protein [Trebonia sp.]|nr:DedA family protein [Trebonia sp.]